MKVPLTELEDRLERFRTRMDSTRPGWELAAIVGKIPPYYFTGTMQDGLLLVPRDGEAVFWVRQSFERAKTESLFPPDPGDEEFPGRCSGYGPPPVHSVSRNRPDVDRPALAVAEVPAVYGREVS